MVGVRFLLGVDLFLQPVGQNLHLLRRSTELVAVDVDPIGEERVKPVVADIHAVVAAEEEPGELFASLAVVLDRLHGQAAIVLRAVPCQYHLLDEIQVSGTGLEAKRCTVVVDVGAHEALWAHRLLGHGRQGKLALPALEIVLDAL